MEKIKKNNMVGWYDPCQLGRTGVQVLISTIFGRNADKRIMQALADPGSLTKKSYYEVVGKLDTEFWFDYIADVGDGFASTYTMAYYLSRPTLPLATRSKTGEPAGTYETPRGEMLIFGGDEVYPTADFKTYKERLISLYEAVFPKKTDKQMVAQAEKSIPTVFAVPGNHDWYDSLVAFSDIFCSHKRFAGWQTLQNRSYFAIKLPMGWWLFGTDMQLGSSLDNAQIDYFKKVMNDVKPDDRIILCNAEPHWITAKMYDGDPAYNNRNMGYFEGGILRRQVAIYVAGDRHYYRRHEETRYYSKEIDPKSKSKVQKIVAGGGGAFLHPTHKEYVDEIGRQHIFALRETYPAESTSMWLTYWNLLFPLWNLKFAPVTGVMYLLTAQAFLTDLGKFRVDNLAGAILTVISAALTQPLALFWVVLIFAGFVLFTDTHKKLYKYIAGPLHALVHLAGVFFIGWFAAYYVGIEAGVREQSVPRLLEMAAIIFVFGSAIGAWLMGLYLLISLNLFGVHHNETFSALKIADYKNFLRFKIDEKTGDLTIFPVGVERVIGKRNWKDGDKKKAEPTLVPDPSKIGTKNEAFLIEEPIVFVKPLVKAAPKTVETRIDGAAPSKEPRVVEERNLEN